MTTKKHNWVDVGSQIEGLKDESWQYYWAEMTAAEGMSFLGDPKSSLLASGMIDDDYRITSEVINSDISADSSGPHCSNLFIFPEEKLAKFVAYRHPPEKS